MDGKSGELQILYFIEYIDLHHGIILNLLEWHVSLNLTFQCYISCRHKSQHLIENIIFHWQQKGSIELVQKVLKKWGGERERIIQGLKMARDVLEASIVCASESSWMGLTGLRSSGKGKKQRSYKLPLFDFDDQLYMPMLCDLPLREEGMTPLSWLFIDEAQDTSRVRLIMAERLVGNFGRLFMVGDVMQVSQEYLRLKHAWDKQQSLRYLYCGDSLPIHSFMHVKLISTGPVRLGWSGP